MVAEQTLPSIAAYFAAMLYNPNNVSKEAAPETAGKILDAYRHSAFNVMHVGVGEIGRALGSEPVLIAPQTHHYCFPKTPGHPGAR